MPEENANISPAPMEPMEPKVEATVESTLPEEPVEPKEPKKKSNTLAIVLLFIFALLGIGFGVYGMFFYGASDNCNTDCPKCDCPSCTENETDCPKCEECEPCSGSEAISADYIYLPEWGVKIKRPVGGLSYTMTPRQTLRILGTDCRNGKCQYLPDFANPEKNPYGLVAVRKLSDDEVVQYKNGTLELFGDKPFEAAGFVFTISNAQAVYSQDREEMEWESTSLRMLKEWFANPENYVAL